MTTGANIELFGGILDGEPIDHGKPTSRTATLHKNGHKWVWSDSGHLTRDGRRRFDLIAHVPPTAHPAGRGGAE